MYLFYICLFPDIFHDILKFSNSIFGELAILYYIHKFASRFSFLVTILIQPLASGIASGNALRRLQDISNFSEAAGGCCEVKLNSVEQVINI